MTDETATPESAPPAAAPPKRKRIRKRPDPVEAAKLADYIKANPQCMAAWNTDWHRAVPEWTKRGLYAKRYAAAQRVKSRERVAARQGETDATEPDDADLA